MNEDWTKDIQRLMADRKVKAPDGLLEEVKQRLASTPPLPPASRFSLREKWRCGAIVGLLPPP